ncbi:MAG: hypothetical protein ACTTJ0_01925 [Porphyromonas endodontalis]|uniref:hypothetical protein n=1 Tax=Porphyromonas endodontalis TaxID=28124 RepID=UPI003F9FC5DB
MSNDNNGRYSQYKHEEVSISLNIGTIKERVYSYASNVASRVANDEEGFDKSSLNLDNDSFIFGDGLFGLISQSDVSLISRLSVYEVSCDIVGDRIVIKIDNCPMVRPREGWINTLAKYLYNFYCTSLISQWFEMIGLQDKFSSYSTDGVDESLEKVRSHIDSAYLKPNRIKFHTLGF